MTPALLLLDNGSLEAAATLNLRRIARALSEKLGREVAPVSLLHSHKVPPEQLEGKPADIFERFVKARLAEGQTEFLVIPLFFGPSGAIVDYLPERLGLLRQKHPELRVRVAPCLVDTKRPEDQRIAAILEDNLAGLFPTEKEKSAPSPALILVDHGSPKREVCAVRNHLAEQLAARLGNRVSCVLAASMERRPEPDFDFNEPLLERAFSLLPGDARVVLVSQLFLSPGRHAGPGGDIEQICRRAMESKPGLRILRAPLVGEHPALIELLAERVAAELRG